MPSRPFSVHSLGGVLSVLPSMKKEVHSSARGSGCSDGYVQLVEFTREGAKASALLGYGNASQPFSTHATNQLSYFEAKHLRPTYRTPAKVEKRTVSRKAVN
ncbi:MAG: penicillin acylase family protein [Candidatus Binataceae bacterium]